MNENNPNFILKTNHPTKSKKNADVCPTILYYKGFTSTHINSGLDHHSNLFYNQIADAVHYKFTHIIIEKMDLNILHNHKIPKDKINQSYWNYFDVEELGKTLNITILQYNDPQAIHLLTKYENNVTSTHFDNICNNEISSPKQCGITIRTHFNDLIGRFWPRPKCFSNRTAAHWISLHPHPSKKVLKCVNDLKMYKFKVNDNDNECFIHGRVRRGDRLKEYSPKYRILVSDIGISVLFTYLAEKVCNGKTEITFYIATDGKQSFVDNINQNLQDLFKELETKNNYDSFMLLTKNDLFKINNSDCAAQLKINNYFVFEVEKEIATNNNITDVSFAFNPKFLHNKLNNKMSEDSFQAFYGDNINKVINIDLIELEKWSKNSLGLENFTLSFYVKKI